MTRAEALYEIAELAGTAIHKAVPDKNPPELFAWCEALKDEAVSLAPISGTPYSSIFKTTHKWLLAH